jgi:hypothetical protein
MDQPVVTAAELEAMTPAERQASFDASVVTDLEQVPPERRDRIEALRERALERIARQDMPNAS